MHTEVAAVLDGASVTVTQSERGLEGGLITISDGTVDLTSSDDGINASGSITVEAGLAAVAESSSDTTTTDTTTQQMGPGGMADGGGSMEDTGEQLTITGGTVTVNANGDGLDSNGSLTISGGTTTVYGPASGANGALDSNGAMSITGGTVIAFATNEMVETPTTTDGQGWISTAASGSAGSTVTISDSSGSVLGTYTSLKAFGNVIYSTSGMTNGSTYTVSVDGTPQRRTPPGRRHWAAAWDGWPAPAGGPEQGGQPRWAARDRVASPRRVDRDRAVSPRPHPRAEASQ